MSTVTNCKSNMISLLSKSAIRVSDPLLRPTALLLGEGMREIFANREACRTAGLYYGVVAVGIFAGERISCIGGMAGEW